MQISERNDTNISDKKISAAVANLSKFKLVFVGDQSVGKTSIINRFIFDTFDGRDHPTVGIDFISKIIYINNTQIRLQLWDTAGQERFRSLIPSYIRDATIVIIVYDVTNEITFQNLQRWYDEIKNIRGDEALIAIIGNKIDKVEDRKVLEKDAQEKAKDLKCIYMEVSAKTGDHIQEMFEKITLSFPGLESSQVMTANPTNVKADKTINLETTTHEKTKPSQGGCCR